MLWRRGAKHFQWDGLLAGNINRAKMCVASESNTKDY